MISIRHINDVVFWNQEFKDYFIDTVLLNYPCPGVFLFEDLSPEGLAQYNVVDGKQRLSAVFDFLDNLFPVPESASHGKLRGKYFKDLDDDTKRSIWKYQLLVEYLPTSEESVINNIFDRINRNVARLKPQELRHARFGGEFIRVSEELTYWMFDELPAGFPNIALQSQKQMKDVELTASLLLLLEEGVRRNSNSQQYLDEAFASREEGWEHSDNVRKRFRAIVRKLRTLANHPSGNEVAKSRLRNQADFYSLFGALDAVRVTQNAVPDAAKKLVAFMEKVDDEDSRNRNKKAQEYYNSVRAASNDAGNRTARIRLLTEILEKASTK